MALWERLTSRTRARCQSSMAWERQALLLQVDTPGGYGRQGATMQSDMIPCLLFYLLPGLAIIVLARKIVDWQARLYPRWYGPLRRLAVLLALYAGGAWWVVQGLHCLGRR
mgnify:FL=1